MKVEKSKEEKATGLGQEEEREKTELTFQLKRERRPHGLGPKRKENWASMPNAQSPKAQIKAQSKLLRTPKQPKPNQFGLHYSLFISPIRIGLPKNPKPN
jgi:hypothetical protein